MSTRRNVALSSSWMISCLLMLSVISPACLVMALTMSISPSDVALLIAEISIFMGVLFVRRVIGGSRSRVSGTPAFVSSAAPLRSISPGRVAPASAF